MSDANLIESLRDVMEAAESDDTPTFDAAADDFMRLLRAEFERRSIGERTRAALAAKRAAGVKLGRPRALPTRVVKRTKREREAGRSYRAIADALNRDSVPTAQGGERWWPATVRAVAAQS